jgi:hypothetical protein
MPILCKPFLSRKLVSKNFKLLITMTENVHLSAGSSQAKKPKLSYNSGESPRLIILSNGFLHSAKSCILVFKENRYLINVGEGLQRLCQTQKHKPEKINNILITQVTYY